MMFRYPQIFVLVTAFFLQGCAPLVFTAGAGAGYTATQEKPRNSIESFFDDLGRSIRQTTRKITGSGSRRSSGGTTRSGVFRVRILRSTLAPTEVHKGEQVTMTLQYQITGAAGQGVSVREKGTLLKEGKELTVLKDESNVRENGTWENTLSFAVPESAKGGSYAVTLQISAQGQTRNARHSFTLR